MRQRARHLPGVKTGANFGAEHFGFNVVGKPPAVILAFAEAGAIDRARLVRFVGITPTVRRASAGAADRVPFFAATNLARTLKLLKDAGVWLTGFAGDGAQSLYASDFKGPVGIVIGSEGEGMRRLTREACDFVAAIPMRGSVESLNVSVATGIVLFEVLRQRSL